MAQIYDRLERAVARWVRMGRLEPAITYCEQQLAALPTTDYHQALGRSWLPHTPRAALWLSRFWKAATGTMAVRALYCEMNRFENNTDEWYVDGFAYDFFGDPDESGWLVGWKRTSGDKGRLLLPELADLQRLFARDYRDEPPSKVRAASEAVILLLTLRMQELIQAAAVQARRAGTLPEDVPVLAAAHDSCLISVSYGQIKVPVTRPEPARPVMAPLPKPGARCGIYEIDGGCDEFNNSLPWDMLDYASERDFERLRNMLEKETPLAARWKPPRVKLRRRKWSSDIIGLYPHWAVGEKGRTALEPLIRDHAEFLPLRCAGLPQLWVMHPLRHIDLSPDAVHNAAPGDNMTVIRRHAFDPRKLDGVHFFCIKQAPGSPSRKAGHCFGGRCYVSEEFRRAVHAHGLDGIVFTKVFAYRPFP